MYVCPNCQEEIPDRVRETQDECPFCREPWPGEAVDIPPEEPKKAGGGPVAVPRRPGAAGAAPAEGAPEPVHAEPPPPSKAWIFILLAVVVLGGGGTALYFLKFRKGAKGKKSGWEVDVGGTKVTLKKVYEDEYEYMLKWQKEVRKIVLKYLADRCDTYRAKGFKFASSLVKVEHMVSAKKKVKELKLEIKTLQGKEIPKASFDWFSCPLLLAFVHKEHAITVKMTFWAQERTLGATLRRSIIHVKGGRYVAGRGTYKSSWDLGRRGLRFSSLHKEGVHPSVTALSGNKIRRVKNQPKVIKLGGVPFTKIGRMKGSGRGGFMVGVWTATFKTDTFAKLLESWAVGCRRLKRTLRELHKTYEDKAKFKLPPLKEQANQVALELCRGMTVLNEATKAKWDKTRVDIARRHIDKALKLAQTTINGPLKLVGKKAGSDQPPEPWCGALNKGSACKE